MNIRQSQPGPFKAVCGALLLVSPCQCGREKIVMRYSHSSSAMVKEPHHAAALDFKNYVEKATNGKVDVRCNSQLGGEERSFQDIQQGVIQIASLAVQQLDGVQPLNGRVRPAVHVSQLWCYKSSSTRTGTRSTSA